MLTEQRFDIILKLLEERKSITVTELRELLDASESTVRRDITALDKAGKLTKVFGGAVALNHKVTAYEPTVAQKSELNKEEKKKIAKYAASLITSDDFVYLDAGTTTGLMLEYLAGAFAKPVKLVRTMPNTPALVGEGITGVCHNDLVTKEELDYICNILSGFGMAQVLSENLMDVVVSVSGSSPAYVFMLIEAMADGAVADGMPGQQAYQFAAQAV